MNDHEIRAALRTLDRREDVSVTSWETTFIENVVYKSTAPLTAAQRVKALQILEKYE